MKRLRDAINAQTNYTIAVSILILFSVHNCKNQNQNVELNHVASSKRICSSFTELLLYKYKIQDII